MPYSGTSDPDLPDAVKALSDKKKRQWIEVFNSAYSSCIDDGGTADTCEPSAFAQAWGVVNKEDLKGGRIVDVKSFIKKLLTREVVKDEPTSQERMQSLGTFYEAVWNAVATKDEQAWLNDIFMQEDGTMLAIIASEGKLFKCSIAYADEEVTLGDWIEVKIDFPEVAQSRTTIHRMKDGKVRFLSVSGSTVLNRSGQIDSKKLFDSFVEHIDKTGEYPVRMFCHCGEQYITGQVDFVARDENLLITSGIFNDTELAKREIASREAEPEYWGESIGFASSAEPEYIELAKDITVPVFTEGVLREVSAVPERYAAAWFTETTQFDYEEVNRMLDKRAKEALVKLFDGDEVAAETWLEENVDAKNRIIEDRNMITRTTEQTVEPVTPVEPVAPVEPVTQTTEPVVTEPVATEPVGLPTLELDDAAVEAIVTQLVTRQSAELDAALTPLKDSIKSLDDRVSALEKMIKGDEGEEEPPEVTELKDRMTALEAAVEASRQKTWYEDLPIKSTLRVTHRPREGADSNEVAPAKPETYADVADATLESLNVLKSKY